MSWIIVLLLLPIVLVVAQRAEGQEEDAEAARDQLFALFTGQEIGRAMSNAMLAY